jgi:mRNA-degrading endonuclease RelE of RelBE toxin-antitoxin system
MDSDRWTIIEHQEYQRTIRMIPIRIRRIVESQLKPQMELDPFINSIELKNELDGFYEQKQGLEKYRLVFRILNYNSKIVQFCWIRAKPFVTTRNWFS